MMLPSGHDEDASSTGTGIPAIGTLVALLSTLVMPEAIEVAHHPEAKWLEDSLDCASAVLSNPSQDVEAANPHSFEFLQCLLHQSRGYSPTLLAGCHCHGLEQGSAAVLETE